MPEVERKLDYLEALKREFQKVAILYNKKSLSKDKNVRLLQITFIRK